jgi:hypothetical protein
VHEPGEALIIVGIRSNCELTDNVNITTAKVNATRCRWRQTGFTAGIVLFPSLKMLSYRTEELPRPLIDQNGNYQAPSHQLPKETRCWRAGDRLECRTN